MHGALLFPIPSVDPSASVRHYLNECTYRRTFFNLLAGAPS